MRHLLILGVVAATVLGTTASARSTADDLSALVFLSQGANVTEVRGSTFGIVIEVEGSTGVPRAVTIRTALPGGLTFATAPTAEDACTGTLTDRELTLVCTKSMVLDGAGTARASWRWSLRASSPGAYTISATASSAEADPNPQNDTGTLRFQVVPDVTTPPGGTDVALQAGAVRLTPAKPRAGSTVRASVRVTAGGDPIRPSRVVCAARVAGAKAPGTARADAGAAVCSFKTSARSRGKLLRGSIRITARGTTLVRRFSARLS
ncbi:MAG TPA: hypothetical protein VFU99_10610 [Gaiellaceae bacterium]|nr:hypothetical protein [Gaiellaceae bacterium]